MPKKPNFSLKKNVWLLIIKKSLKLLEIIGWPMLWLIKLIINELDLFFYQLFNQITNLYQKTIAGFKKITPVILREYPKQKARVEKSLLSLSKQGSQLILKFRKWFFQRKKEVSHLISLINQQLDQLKTKLVGLILVFKKSVYINLKRLRQTRLPKIVFPKFTWPRLHFWPTKPIFQLKFPKPHFPKLSLSRKVLLFSFFLFLSGMAVGLFLVINFLRSLPPPETLRTRNIILTTKIYDRNNILLYKIYKNQNRTLVNLSDLPKYLINATVAIEDKDFYHHRGLSYQGILRAIRQNYFLRQRLEGGSTITQQLVKNALLTPERTFLRKVKEIILALEVESQYSKEEILTMYFNEVGYGGAAYGIAEASEMYFGKTPNDLTLAESAFLAGLPAAPTFYSPFGVNPQLSIERQYEVLRRMTEDGYTNESEEQKAKSEKLEFTQQLTDIKAPHFVMYVKDLLVQKYGEKMVEQGGLIIRTSLDLSVQQMAEKEVRQGVLNQQYLFVGNGAALITKPSTGEILAMVGSKDYWDIQNDGNVNVCLMERQPGSSIKPVNYALALQKGLTPTTVIPDTPIAFAYPGQPPYVPQNYDGRFHGNVTLRQALGNSYNIPAVKVLASYGVEQMIDIGQKLGITTWNDPSRFGLSLTLGGGEVKMVDMAVAFGVFANSGNRVDLNPILEVKDSHGRLLESLEYKLDDPEFKKPVLPEGVAFLISNILADNNARSATFGPNSPLVILGHTVSVKTGTTDTKRDNWTIGYTPSYLTAVWIGNNDNTPMSMYLESGFSGAAPIWHNIMANLLKDQKDELLAKPDSVVELAVCVYNGLLPCRGCPTKNEYFLYGTEPKVACRSEDLRPTPTNKPL